MSPDLAFPKFAAGEGVPGEKLAASLGSKLGWSDSHSHLCDQRWGIDFNLSEFKHPALDEALQAGIQFFLQGGVDPKDWNLQKKIHQHYPQVGLCFGLHPYFVSNNEQSVCEAALDQLAREISSALALGETGLDFRPHILKEDCAESMGRQIDMFVAQLELATFAQKPVVLHLVRSFEKAQEIFSYYGQPTCGAMVHAFNGSTPEAEYYLSQNFFLSVGGALCRPDNQKLRQSVQITPISKILIESDSPDQPPPSFMGQKNRPITVVEVADIIAKIKKMSREEVLDIAAQNLQNFLHAKPNR